MNITAAGVCRDPACPLVVAMLAVFAWYVHICPPCSFLFVNLHRPASVGCSQDPLNLSGRTIDNFDHGEDTRCG